MWFQLRKKRIQDVPKGKRWEFFLTYYSRPLLLGLLCGGLVAYTLYLAIWKPPADFSILILSDSFDLSCESAMRECFSREEALDLNGDGTVRVLLNFFQFDPVSGDFRSEDKMALMTILSAGDTDLFLANESAAQWLNENGLIAGNEFAELIGCGDDFTSGIAVADIPLFRDPAFQVIQPLTLYFANPRQATQQLGEKTAALFGALR